MKSRAPAFSVMETLVALGILSVAMTLLAEITVWSLGEVTRSDTRQQSLELADNILESARALPWEGLTPEWAAAQRLPEPLAQRLCEGQLTVRVEPESSRQRTKRLTVEIHWKLNNGQPARPVQLVGLFSARSVEAPGGKP